MDPVTAVRVFSTGHLIISLCRLCTSHTPTAAHPCCETCLLQVNIRKPFELNVLLGGTNFVKLYWIESRSRIGHFASARALTSRRDNHYGCIDENEMHSCALSFFRSTRKIYADLLLEKPGKTMMTPFWKLAGELDVAAHPTIFSYRPWCSSIDK